MQAMNVQEVTLDPLAGGPGHNWKVSHGGQSGSDPSTYPAITLTPGSGPWLIHFTIQNHGSNITFDSDPIWVQPASKPASHTIDPQITAVVPSSDGKELFVLDKNDNPTQQTLYYSLQFTGHGQVDPIITNGGHPMTSTYPSETANTVTLNYATFGVVIIVALIVGALAGALLRRK